MIKYRIGLYDENKVLIGYKADTFWSLTKKPEHAKTHWLENGGIPEHLISNLHSILSKTVTPAVNGLLSGIAEINRARFFGHFETMLVGYDVDGVAPVFTHRVFPEGVEPIELSSQPDTKENT